MFRRNASDGWVAGEGKTAVGIAIFFALKLILGLAVLVAGARLLGVAGFAIYSQLLVLLAFLVTLASAGVQHGLIRQIAAAQDDRDGEPAAVRAALAIWAGAGATLVVAGNILGPQISEILVGTRSLADAVGMLALLSAITGLGTLLCAMLTGKGRTLASLAAQGLGLIAATGATLILLSEQRPVAAALAFAAGPILTTFVAAVLVRRTLANALFPLRGPTPRLAEMARQLTGYSAAFLITAALMPLTLLALRAAYRDSFGLELLGLWLAANRISDVNTQLLGLYFSQDYLPRRARAFAGAARKSLFHRSFAIATGAMLAGLAVFWLAPRFWIAAILSEKFVPAVTMVGVYLAGDVLRVGASLIGFTALADRRLVLYVSLEAAAAVVLSAGVLITIAAGLPDGPAWAYAATYLTISVFGVAACRRWLFSGEQREMPLRGQATPITRSGPSSHNEGRV